jgi:hypothetical protein
VLQSNGHHFYQNSKTGCCKLAQSLKLHHTKAIFLCLYANFVEKSINKHFEPMQVETAKRFGRLTLRRVHFMV